MEGKETTYSRFSSCERVLIEKMINEGARLSDIARRVGKDPTSISREAKPRRASPRVDVQAHAQPLRPPRRVQEGGPVPRPPP